MGSRTLGIAMTNISRRRGRARGRARLSEDDGVRRATRRRRRGLIIFAVFSYARRSPGRARVPRWRARQPSSAVCCRLLAFSGVAGAGNKARAFRNVPTERVLESNFPQWTAASASPTRKTPIVISRSAPRNANARRRKSRESIQAKRAQRPL